MLFMFRVCHAFLSFHCSLVATCWERAGLLALLCVMFYVFVTFMCGVLGEVWYFIVLIFDLCLLTFIKACICSQYHEKCDVEKPLQSLRNVVKIVKNSWFTMFPIMSKPVFRGGGGGVLTKSDTNRAVHGKLIYSA